MGVGVRYILPYMTCLIYYTYIYVLVISQWANTNHFPRIYTLDGKRNTTPEALVGTITLIIW